MLIDTHAHLTADTIAPQADALIARARLAGVNKIVNICTDPLSLAAGLELSGRDPSIFNVAATTPHDVEKEGELFFPQVEKAAAERRLVGIGETGLDYFYEHSPKELQKKYLKKYFTLALQYQLPLVIHCREAFQDLFQAADEAYRNAPALLHCFTGTLEEARAVLERGWYLSFSGIITFKKSEELREVIKFTPLDRMVVETDTPYLAPQTHRGKQNEPAFIVETAMLIAEIKQLPFEEIARVTSENACKIFPF